MGSKFDQLPDAVPPDNSARARADFSAVSEDAASFGSIPDMATPAFARPDFDQASARTVRERHEVHERVVESEDDETDDSNGNDDAGVDAIDMRRPILLLIAIVGLLGALGAIVLSQNRQGTPLCSTQPSWNQYNCAPG